MASSPTCSAFLPVTMDELPELSTKPVLHMWTLTPFNQGHCSSNFTSSLLHFWSFSLYWIILISHKGIFIFLPFKNNSDNNTSLKPLLALAPFLFLSICSRIPRKNYVYLLSPLTFLSFFLNSLLSGLPTWLHWNCFQQGHQWPSCG